MDTSVIDAPIKSPNDKREYRVIKLKNGLTALLISDEGCTPSFDSDYSDIGGAVRNAGTDSGHESEEDISDEDSGASGDELENDNERQIRTNKVNKDKMAAAALCVRVGSFSDPIDLPGLAHFLEHMVFMGNEKYPDENCYDAFIYKHGGSDNAFTDCDRTVFKMEVTPKHFHEALDMFAQCFTSPLLKVDSMDKEIEAVDSEFQLNAPSDVHRKAQLFGSFAKDGHPMAKFMWGNSLSLKETPELKNINVNECLQKFWKRYYSADYMTIAVQSTETLDTLEKWVCEIFSGIPNNGLPPASFKTLVEPFETEKFHKLYKMVPVKKTHQVIINWALPPVGELYRVKPLHYIGWLVGHEGKGSIIAYLRKRSWALSLYAGNDESGFEQNETCSLFNICIVMTESGMDHVTEVITTVFQYLQMIRDAGPQERIFQELQAIESNKFRFQEQSDTSDYVETLAENMQQYPSQHYLVGDQLYFEYDEKIIRNFQEIITVDNSNIIILSTHYHEGMCKEIEPWTQAPYCCEDFPQEWLSLWKDLKVPSDLHLPVPNKFIATDFDLKCPDVLEDKCPIKIFEDNQSRIWYKKDNKFKVPKAHLYFHLITPESRSSSINAAMMDLFVRILHQILSEDAYPADVAGLSYSVYGDDTGLIIQVYGFNHKLTLLFETILDHIAGFDVDEICFENMKKHLMKSYYNSFIMPGKLCKDMRLSVLQQTYWSSVEKRSVLLDVTKEMLLTFVQQCLSGVFIEGLLQGNVTAEEAKSLNQLIMKKIKAKPLPPQLLPELRVMQIPEGEHFCRVASFSMDDQNSAVANYYQSGPGDIRKICLMELLMAHMSEPCFDTLRTQEQLGYDVSCSSRNSYGIVGFIVTVQSPAKKFSCSHIDERIEAFLHQFALKIKELSEDEFNTQDTYHKDVKGKYTNHEIMQFILTTKEDWVAAKSFQLITSLIQLKKCEDLYLKEEVDRNWSEIVSFNYVFDRLEKEIDHLKSITREELKAWCHNQIIEKQSRKKLGIQVVGPGEKALEECDTADFINTDASMVIENKGTDVDDYYSGENDEMIISLDEPTEDILYLVNFLRSSDLSKASLFITDINIFKEKLSVYPVCRITS